MGWTVSPAGGPLHRVGRSLRLPCTQASFLRSGCSVPSKAEILKSQDTAQEQQQGMFRLTCNIAFWKKFLPSHGLL